MKLKRKSALIVLICTMLITISSSMAYANTVSGTLAGKAVSGSSYAYQTSGYSSTSLSDAVGSVTVSATYWYINMLTHQTYSYTGGNGGSSSATINFSAPQNGQTVDISGSHYVFYSGQTWTASSYSKY
jgi:hypothetical protein